MNRIVSLCSLLALVALVGCVGPKPVPQPPSSLDIARNWARLAAGSYSGAAVVQNGYTINHLQAKGRLAERAAIVNVAISSGAQELAVQYSTISDRFVAQDWRWEYAEERAQSLGAAKYAQILNSEAKMVSKGGSTSGTYSYSPQVNYDKGWADQAGYPPFTVNSDGSIKHTGTAANDWPLADLCLGQLDNAIVQGSAATTYLTELRARTQMVVNAQRAVRPAP